MAKKARLFWQPRTHIFLKKQSKSAKDFVSTSIEFSFPLKRTEIVFCFVRKGTWNFSQKKVGGHENMLLLLQWMTMAKWFSSSWYENEYICISMARACVCTVLLLPKNLSVTYCRVIEFFILLFFPITFDMCLIWLKSDYLSTSETRQEYLTYTCMGFSRCSFFLL